MDLSSFATMLGIIELLFGIPLLIAPQQTIAWMLDVPGEHSQERENALY